MIYDDVNIKIISRREWGLKADPTEYVYEKQTILIREDYFSQMKKNNPLTHHWFVHEFAHHIQLKSMGIDYIKEDKSLYPDNKVERYAFAYQFYYLMEKKCCQTIQELFDRDHFFRQKRIYSNQLTYYWNNANFILGDLPIKTS